jgi:phospholipid/cholesterol/gamma-HCH transport system substrate-binding protein
LIARLAAFGALVAAIVIVAVLLFGGGGGTSYRLIFENAGQLVPGNEVRIGGHVVGSVDSVDLTDDYQAAISISTDEPLHDGTTAVVRSTSLSGVANRYVSLTAGPGDAPELAGGSTLPGHLTTSAVDLDQLFDTFTPRTRTALRDVLQGFASIYVGRGEQANSTYKYLGPGLQATTRLFAELDRDQQTLTDFLVQGSRVVTTVAAQHDALTSLVSNTNQALGAIAQENTSLDRALVALPPALRQANTTFVNLRAALDDLDPLVATAKPATADLVPFLSQLRGVATASTPVFAKLSGALLRPGPSNDLVDALRDQPGFERQTAAAVSPILKGLDSSQATLDFARPYVPDLLGAITKLGQATGYYDAAGHYARVQSAALGLFHANTTTHELNPIPPSQQFDDLEFSLFTRCPGGATQPVPGSNPFTDGGALLSGGQPPNPKCDPSDVPPGP